jgi:hypothetical protein
LAQQKQQQSGLQRQAVIHGGLLLLSLSFNLFTCLLFTARNFPLISRHYSGVRGSISPFGWKFFPCTVEGFPLPWWKDLPSYRGRKLGMVEELPLPTWKDFPPMVEGFPPAGAGLSGCDA